MKLGGAYPYAFVSRLVGDSIKVYYRTQHVYIYPLGSIRTNLTHVYLDRGNIEYYIKGTNV